MQRIQTKLRFSYRREKQSFLFKAITKALYFAFQVPICGLCCGFCAICQNSSKKTIDKRYSNFIKLSHHKECDRDSPYDRTATCICKVLKAERWCVCVVIVKPPFKKTPIVRRWEFLTKERLK